MKPTIKIYVDTTDGQAIIASLEEFNDLGNYTIAGPGKEMASEWIENAWGAFGHNIGKYAATCDLHSAAMDLQQEPQDEVRFIKVESEIKEYDSGIPEGSIA